MRAEELDPEGDPRDRRPARRARRAPERADREVQGQLRGQRGRPRSPPRWRPLRTSSAGSARSGTRARSPRRWSSSPPRGCAGPRRGSWQMRDYADRMKELTAGTARAAASLRGLRCCSSARRRGGDRPADRRPRPGRRVQRAGAAPRVRARAQLRGDGVEVRWLVVGRKGRSTLGSAATRSTRAGSVQRPARPTTTRRRSPAGWPSSTRRGRPRGDRLQRVRLGARPARGRARPAADPGGGARHDEEEDEEQRRCSATSSTSPSPRRSSSACCRSTSRPSSTARCSSRPPPSRARG